ncbi:MAG: hypothetical protein HY043_11150 [Verrucomicrobia bacterium]|nr:hypothetical protein [Verrucomicrobiota bacterium]
MLSAQKLLCLLGAIASTLTISAADSVIEGTVTLLSPKADAVAAARYQTSSGKKIGKPDAPVAVIFLEGNFTEAQTGASAAAQMGQTNFQFTPGILVVRKGTTVEFPNFDDDYHNVFSYSKTKRFDLGRYRKGEKPASLLFDQRGVINLRCEIHEHMRGTILVLDTPHFSKTGTNGTYRLERLPAGKFTLKCWRDEKNVAERLVEIKPSETLKIDWPAP